MTCCRACKPRNFYDLVIEVAIVRPGPIQGDMVHPYLRRRRARRRSSTRRTAADDGKVLGKTLGVPLFQEQAMKIAIVAAGFTPARPTACAAPWRRSSRAAPSALPGEDDRGMSAAATTGISPSAAFSQIEGFGSYGFPESHAAASRCWSMSRPG